MTKRITKTELKTLGVGLIVFHAFAAVLHRLGHHGQPRTWTDVVVATIVMPLVFLTVCYFENKDLKEDGR